jgi:hypothetical protein
MKKPLLPSRTTINHALALIGVVIILYQTLMMAWERIEVAIVLLGIVVNQIGVWRLAGRVLPNMRTYLQLRAEADRFIGLVRHLNTHAVAGDDAEVESTRAEMRDSVDQMVEVAAVKDEDG